MSFLARVLFPFNVMVRSCAWCNTIQGFRKGGRGITHGICQRCLVTLRSKGEKE